MVVLPALGGPTMAMVPPGWTSRLKSAMSGMAGS
jgi:hypothetical protein